MRIISDFYDKFQLFRPLLFVAFCVLLFWRKQLKVYSFECIGKFGSKVSGCPDPGKTMGLENGDRHAGADGRRQRN